MSATREKNERWNLLDLWQFYRIKRIIRLAKKDKQNHILFWNVARPKVFKKMKDLDCRIYVQGGKNGYTWIFW